MTPAAVATLVTDHQTSSSAMTAAPSVQVAYMGAVSTLRAESCLGTPEDAIDYAAGAEALLAAENVEEAQSSPVSTGSPFGI